MKKTSTQQSKNLKQTAIKQIKTKNKSSHYLQLSNQQYLRRNIILLGVTQSSFVKQTKCSIQAEFFPKHQTNPTGTKQFFYISYVCLQKLTNSDQIESLKMWYPPRNVNQQLQYKKVFFKIIQNLQTLGRIPKNIIVSKGTIMGDSSSGVLIEFLRFLSQMSLRHQYLEKYSKRERLIQISCNHSTLTPENNINKFYIHPFVPSSTISSFDHPSLDLNQIKQVYHDYIKIYLKKLIKLRTKNFNPILSQRYQKLMKQFMQQKQLSQILKQKVPPALLTQNRAFDRRRIIDKTQQIWNELNKVQCNYIEEKQIPILQLQGEVDKLLQKWQPVKGISNILEANSALKNLQNLKKKLSQQITNFNQLNKKLEEKLKKI